jgi:hypothetical protein
MHSRRVAPAEHLYSGSYFGSPHADLSRRNSLCIGLSGCLVVRNERTGSWCNIMLPPTG